MVVIPNINRRAGRYILLESLLLCQSEISDCWILVPGFKYEIYKSVYELAQSSN